MQKISATTETHDITKTISEMNVTGVKHYIGSDSQFITDASGKSQATINRNLEEKVSTIDNIIKQQGVKEYGVEIDFEAETFKRLGDASTFPMDLTAQSPTNPFDNIYPWMGMQRCVLTDDKRVLAYYGQSGYEEDGVTGQCMVEIPKFYYKVVPLKLEKNPNGSHGSQVLKIQYWICNYPKQGYKLHPAFYNKIGSKINFLYVSAYEGCVLNGDTGRYDLTDTSRMDLAKDKLSSVKDAKPCSGLNKNLHIENARKLANNRGDGWEQQDFTSASAIQLLLLVEFASTDSQSRVGQGITTITDVATDNCSLITGQTSVLGNKSGYMGVNGKSSVSYRGIENFWGNIWKFVDGINIECKGIHLPWISNQNGDYKCNTKNNQYNGANLSKANGYADRIGYEESVDYSFMPSRSTGSSSKSLNDYFYQNSPYNGFLIAILGGNWYNGGSAGCFYWSASYSSAIRNRYVSCRLVAR